MSATQTLYEVLGAPQEASLAELQSAYRREVGVLEAARGSMSPQAFTDKLQLLRVAFSTLSDPATRLGYDAKLAASRPPAARPAAPLALVPQAAEQRSPADVRADALSLRADALSLRADAMLLRSRLDAPAGAGGIAQTVASGTVAALKYFTRAIGLLVLVVVIAFALTRCMLGDSSERRARLEAKAAEQTALQEYYQTHGIRPANMAELELLEAERRRRENRGRTAEQDREKAERDARLFEEESRRRADQVSARLRSDEERARHEAAVERQRQEYEARAKQEAERRRIEQERNQWQEILRR